MVIIIKENNYVWSSASKPRLSCSFIKKFVVASSAAHWHGRKNDQIILNEFNVLNCFAVIEIDLNQI